MNQTFVAAGEAERVTAENGCPNVKVITVSRRREAELRHKAEKTLRTIKLVKIVTGLCGVVCCMGFIMLVGTAGSMDLDRITFGRFISQSIAAMAAMLVAGWLIPRLEAWAEALTEHVAALYRAADKAYKRAVKSAVRAAAAELELMRLDTQHLDAQPKMR